MSKIKLGVPRRRRWFVLGAVAAGVAVAGAAYAAFPETDVKTYTACVGVGGNSGGLISQVAEGTSPLKPCASNQKPITLSGGDITAVTVGAGLTGGGENGAVTIGLDQGHSLPQQCGAGAVPKADEDSAWVCGFDNDHQYLAGNGLVLSGNSFSVGSNYQLPQTCSFGEFVVRLNFAWGCSDGKSPLFQRTVGSVNVSQGGWTQVARMEMSNGFYLFTVNGVAIDDSGGDDEVSIECKLYQGSTDWEDTWVDIGEQSSDFGPAAPITMTTVIGDFNNGWVATLMCTSHTGSDHLRDVRLTALPIGTLTNR